MGLRCRPRLRGDRRVVMLALSEEGKALALDPHRRAQANDTRLSEGVREEEMAVFASVLSKAMANYTARQIERTTTANYAGMPNMFRLKAPSRVVGVPGVI